MIDWQKGVCRILECESDDLIELAKAAGVSPIRLYRGANLNGADLRQQDLRGIDLSGTTLDGAIFDKGTLIDAEFDPRIDFSYIKRSISVPRNLYICVRVYEADNHYQYTGWAIKSLLQYANYQSSYHGGTTKWVDWIQRSQSAQTVISQQGARSYFLKVKRDLYDDAVEQYSAIGGKIKALRIALLIGMFRFWNANPEDIGDRPIVEFLKDLPKSDRANSVLASLSRNWIE